uniref:NR LBD domain-containing protein n=1 Tax=Caenorhabditis tropicalis TaxID=1561998 RepID=A0A1I7TY66_9PELO
MRYRGAIDEKVETMEVLRQNTEQPSPSVFPTPMDELCSMIQTVLVLDSKRLDCLGKMRKEEDLSIQELIEKFERGFSVDRDKETSTSVAPNNNKVLSQWSFFGVWTSIEFLKNLEFMHLLSASDKLIIVTNFAMNSYLLSSAFQSVTRQSDRLVNPDGTETISQSLKTMFTNCNIDRVRTQLVAKLCELQITSEEYILITIILFCTPSYGQSRQLNAESLSAYACEIVGEQQRKYYNALMEYCMTTRGGQGPARFQKIISIGELLAKCFGDVRDLVDLLRVFEPNFYNSKQFFIDSLNK